MSAHRAGCSCGQLWIDLEAEPMRISVCHCLACQLRTGGAFGAQARFMRTAATIHGRSTLYVRTADSGHTIMFHFCPDCGATVHYQLELFPEFIAIPIGAFADPHFPAPTLSFYESRQHDWVALRGEFEHSE